MNKTKIDYLMMQKNQYEVDASRWALDNRDPVVGSYDGHNACLDYDTLLFKDFDTTGKVALEYGCGPARNLIRYHDRFERIDGVDIAQTNLDKAKINLAHHGITNYNLYQCDGDNIPTDDKSYDVVFSVICLQHICCHSIRYSIMNDVRRVLKPKGYFCFQMGFGGRPTALGPSAGYYDNVYDAKGTNSLHDVVIDNEDCLKIDLTKIGFKNYKSDIRPQGPGDAHKNWIWVQVQK